MEKQISEDKGRSFSCPSCGGRMVFDPETQKMKCPFCDSLKDIDAERIIPNEYALESVQDTGDENWGDKTHVMRCQGCGAQIVLTGETSADICAFCGAPHVMEDQQKAGIAPESILPFKIAKKQAVSGFRTWIGKKLFAPTKAKKMAALGEITGVYLPYWTYDAETTSRYVGQAGHYYYVEVPVQMTRNGKTQTEMRKERKTDWRPTSGVVSNSFDDILIAGSNRLPEYLLSRVRPFDLTKLVRYAPDFISGFISEKPAIDVKAGWKEAEGIIDDTMKSLATKDILRFADEARVNQIESDNQNVKYKLTLLPMYLSSFKYKDKTFHVLVNGQTGRIGGQAPVSAVKVIVFIAAIIALFWLLGMLLSSRGHAAELASYAATLISALG